MKLNILFIAVLFLVGLSFTNVELVEGQRRFARPYGPRGGYGGSRRGNYGHYGRRNRWGRSVDAEDYESFQEEIPAY